MHELPRNRPAVRRKWIKFIQFKQADFLAAPHHAHLCSEHFSECDFANPMEYRMGFASKPLTRCSSIQSFKILPDRLNLIRLYPCRSLGQSFSFVFGARVGHFAANPQSDVYMVKWFGRHGDAFRTIENAFFRAFITLRSQFHLHHRSQRALTEIVSKITPKLGLTCPLTWLCGYCMDWACGLISRALRMSCTHWHTRTAPTHARAHAHTHDTHARARARTHTHERTHALYTRAAARALHVRRTDTTTIYQVLIKISSPPPPPPPRTPSLPHPSPAPHLPPPPVRIVINVMCPRTKLCWPFCNTSHRDWRHLLSASSPTSDWLVTATVISSEQPRLELAPHTPTYVIVSLFNRHSTVSDAETRLGYRLVLTVMFIRINLLITSV